MIDQDFADIRGNDAALLALADAAATRTPVQLLGPPGIAKTMIARRAPALLGPLTDHQRAWVSAEYAGVGMDLDRRDTWGRPFRAPHHTVSAAAMTGATSDAHRIACPLVRTFNPRLPIPMPIRCTCDEHGGKERRYRAGEIMLARFGVLFLDDLIEFSRLTVERIAGAYEAMAPSTRPWLIATGTPCACGWYGSPETPSTRTCACPTSSIARWHERQGNHRAILRMLHVITVQPMSLADLRAAGRGPSTDDLRARVAQNQENAHA